MSRRKLDALLKQTKQENRTDVDHLPAHARAGGDLVSKVADETTLGSRTRKIAAYLTFHSPCTLLFSFFFVYQFLGTFQLSLFKWMALRRRCS